MQAAVAKGRKLPEWFEDEPVQMPCDAFYLKAFWALSTTRQLGMSQGPVPDDKVMAYGEREGLDRENVDLLRTVIRHMDAVYLAWSDKEAEKARKAREGK